MSRFGSPRSQRLTDPGRHDSPEPADAQSIDATSAPSGGTVPFTEGELVDHIRHGTSRYGVSDCWRPVEL